MIKNISAFSVNYPISILMLMLAILLLGVISFDKLGMDLFPDLNNPRLFVEIKSGELPPEEMERQYVESIESVAIRLKKATGVSSVCRVGQARVTVEYSWDADMDEAFLDLQKSISSFAQNLDIDEITVSQYDPNAEPIVLMSLTHPRITDMDELRKTAENYIRNELVRQEGIATVELIGQQDKEVIIEISPYLLEAYNLSLSEIGNKIRSYNRNATAGSIVEMGIKYVIKGVGEFQSFADIGNVIVTSKIPEAQTEVDDATPVPVFLKDIANIDFVNADPVNIVRINGQRAIALAVYKEMKYNTVSATNNLISALRDMRKALPGYEIKILNNQAEFINAAIGEVEESALIGIFLAIIVIFVFLRRIGSTAIISIAIPISVIATFNLMYFNGLTLNIMTLGGLALGAGMLVDNAIVVMENIFRNMETGKMLKEAAIEGTAQVGGAITASTITTIIVFLPIVYLHGAAGVLFRDQAWTVAFSLLSSLVVAVLVIPMLSHYFLRKQSQFDKETSLRFQWYRPLLARILNHRWKVIVTAVLLVIIAVLLLPVVGSEFIPKAGSNHFRVYLELEQGTALQRTDQTVLGVEEMIRRQTGDDLEMIYALAGPGVSGYAHESGQPLSDENSALLQVYLRTNPSKSPDFYIRRLTEALEQMPALDFRIQKEQSALQSTLGGSDKPVMIEIQGEDPDLLAALSDSIKNRISDIPELLNLESGMDEGRLQVELYVDRIRAGINNVSIQTITEQLQEFLEGRESGQWENEGEMRTLRLQLTEPTLNQLPGLYINPGQNKIRLDELVDIKISRAPKEINRRNQNRIVTLNAGISDNVPLDHVIGKIRQRLENTDFPANYRYTITGEEQKRAESFGSLKFALILSVILIYMVMASQFESLIHPFTILLTIPLAVVGAVFIFFFLGLPLNIMAYIGIIMLVGIAVNDSIILVDAINQLKNSGMDVRSAIIEAGQRRIRPILMTSITTILALFPLTLGFGEGAALRAPLALAVIGGLITSTLLTLAVIPCVYALLDRG